MAKRKKAKRSSAERRVGTSGTHVQGDAQRSVPRSREQRSAPRARELPTWVVLVALALLALVFYSPILFAGDAYGVNDWDLMLFHHEAARRSLVVHGAWPSWNPWYCGGGPLLANPQSVFLDPLFALALAFGTVDGARLGVVAHAFLGMLGAWLFARRLGAEGRSGLVAAVAWGFSGVYTLHIATGHLTWFALGYLPFVAACTEGALAALPARDWKRAAREVVLAGAALAATLFTGNAYIFVYGALLVLLRVVLAAPAVRPLTRAWEPLALGAAIGGMGAALSAVKLVPMLDYLERVSRYEVKDASGAPLGQLFSALTSRDPSLTAVEWQGMQWRWWEYGGYVGVPILVLALAGAWVTFRQTWPWVVVLAAFVGLAMGNDGPVWPLLRGLHAFEGLRVPSRAIAVVVLLAAGFAGVGGSFLLRQAVTTLGLAPAAVPGILGLGLAALAINLFAVTRPTLEEAFTAAPPAPAPSSLPPFRQGYGKKVFVTRTPYTDHYEHALRNEGMLNCHERLHLPIRARAPFLRSGAPDAAYKGEVWSRDGARRTEIVSFGPTEIVVAVKGRGADVVGVNQNFDPGWTARISGRELALAELDGVLGVQIPADVGEGTVVVAYRAPGGRSGAALTCVALLLSLAMFFGTRRGAA